MQNILTQSFDPFTERRLLSVYPPLAFLWRKTALYFFDTHELQLKVSAGLRTFEEQWKVWAQGRMRGANGKWFISDMRKVVSYAMPGGSYHNYGLALDTCFLGIDPFLEKMEKEKAKNLWNEFGRIACLHGLEWGGYFRHPDRPHVQCGFGLSIHEIQMIYEKGGLEGVWEECDRRNRRKI